MPSKDGSSNVKASTRVRTEGEEKEGLQYKILPHVDQEETYGAVFQRLKEGGAIGVFPEGKWGSNKSGRKQAHTVQAGLMIGPTSFPLKLAFPSWPSVLWLPILTSMSSSFP